MRALQLDYQNNHGLRDLLGFLLLALVLALASVSLSSNIDSNRAINAGSLDSLASAAGRSCTGKPTTALNKVLAGLKSGSFMLLSTPESVVMAAIEWRLSDE